MEYQIQEPHLYDYLDILRRRRWILMTAFIVTLLSTIIFTFTAIPIFEVSTTIQIEEKKGPKFTLSEFPINPSFQQFDPLKTEAEIIRSRTVISRVVETVQQGEDTGIPLEDRIKGLQSKIKIEPIRGTNILRISLEDEDPQRAVNILNGLNLEYIGHNLSTAKAEASLAKEFVVRQLQTVRAELDNSQSALERFKSKEGVTTLSDDMRKKVDSLSEIEMKRVEIEMERKGLEGLLASLKNNRDLALTDINLSNPAIAEFTRRLAELQVQKASMFNYYKEEHPQIIKINAAMKETKIRLKEEAEKVLNFLKGRERSLGEVVGRYEEEIKKLPQTEQELTNIMRNLKVSEGIFTFLLQKEKEAEIAEASEMGNIRVIDSAIPPNKPVKPKKRQNIILGAIVGLFLGIGLCFFMEYMDDTVKGKDEIERHLGLPVFGVLPRIGDNNGLWSTRRRPAEAPGSLALVTEHRSRSHIGESYRTLRANIQFSEMEKKNKIILITSPIMSEGKSLTAANLATVFAKDGAKVLIIDADLRRPMQDKIFNSPGKPGLTNILIGRYNWSDTAVKLGIETLSLIPSGPIPPNPSELLGTKRMDELLDSLKASFDLIIIDTTPLIGVTDAIVLSQKADGVFIIVEVDRTPVKLALQARDSLRMVKANIIGVILNKVPIERNGYGYAYSYRYYYGEHEDEDKAGGLSFLKRWRDKRKEKDRTGV